MEHTEAAARAADTVHWAFDDYHQRFRAITRRVRERFEHRDWVGIRQDTVERLSLHRRLIGETVESLRGQLTNQLESRDLWQGMKEAYTRTILGRDDFELAQTFFNSLTRRVFSQAGVDPRIDFVSQEVPLPYKGWEMASARMYAVREVDAAVVRRILLDAGFRVPFRQLERDAQRAAHRIREGLVERFHSTEIEAVDMLRPVLLRNKGAYLVGRVRRGMAVQPLMLALLNGGEGLEVDAVLQTEDQASIVFSFARWYFHATVESPREVIGFLQSILPRKRIAELYNSLGYNPHAKTELYRDLMSHIASSDDRFVVAPGQRGLVMAVFTLPSFEMVFKVIKDSFPPSKRTSRHQIMERYRQVLVHDRVGRLVDFQEFEHLSFPRARFDRRLLEELLEVASHTVSLTGDDVVIRHLYVERRVTPLDLYLRDASPEAAVAAVVGWGKMLKDLAAADIFPGDILLKNFGVTRHGRLVSYDYDELRPLTELTFRRFPAARSPEEELSSEPWFRVGEDDVFPQELRTFVELRGPLREVFERHHGDLFEVDFWRGMQERNRRGEIIDFFPYTPDNRLGSQGGS